MRNHWIRLLCFCLCGVLLVSGMLAQTPIRASAASLVWPVPGHTALSQGYHAGNAIDISGGGASGATVIAAMSGTVTHVFRCPTQHYGADGDCYGFGTGVVIAGDDGRIYQYAHMMAYSIPSDIYVGAYVQAAQKIGALGTTGNSSGPHLHFGISIGKYYYQSGINPAAQSYVYCDPLGTLSVTNTVNHSYLVTIPENYRVTCYDSATATNKSTWYWEERSYSFNIFCTQKHTLSDGSVRFFSSGDGWALYFTLSDGMKATAYGDVDGSGTVDSTDARLVLQYAVKKIGSSALNRAVADVNNDKKIDSTDARLILQHTVGKIDRL